MGKPSMLCPLVSVECQPELFDSSQPLELGRIDQRNDQSIIQFRIIEQNDVVNRIAVSTFGHLGWPPLLLSKKRSGDVSPLNIYYTASHRNHCASHGSTHL